MRVARGTLVLVAAALGALFAAGSLLAIVFELQGFGAPDDGARSGYLAALCAGLAASVGLPLVLWRVLLPGSAPSRAAVAAVVLALLVVSLLGVGVLA